MSASSEYKRAMDAANDLLSARLKQAEDTKRAVKKSPEDLADDEVAKIMADYTISTHRAPSPYRPP
jgi:hypothetical protein